MILLELIRSVCFPGSREGGLHRPLYLHGVIGRDPSFCSIPTDTRASLQVCNSNLVLKRSLKFVAFDIFAWLRPALPHGRKFTQFWIKPLNKLTLASA